MTTPGEIVNISAENLTILQSILTTSVSSYAPDTGLGSVRGWRSGPNGPEKIVNVSAESLTILQSIVATGSPDPQYHSSLLTACRTSRREMHRVATACNSIAHISSGIMLRLNCTLRVLQRNVLAAPFRPDFQRVSDEVF
jgi:hypothetical protein